MVVLLSKIFCLTAIRRTIIILQCAEEKGDSSQAYFYVHSDLGWHFQVLQIHANLF